MTPNAERPTHIVANPGDRESLCGIRKPLPIVWAPFVERHVEGYGMAVCSECDAVWQSWLHRLRGDEANYQAGSLEYLEGLAAKREQP